jgi:hypothetical protein
MLSPQKLATSDVTTQVAALKQIIATSPLLRVILEEVPALGVQDWYLSGGSVAQTAWNFFNGSDLNHCIKDCDLVYFDQTDTSYNAENEVISRGQQLFRDLPIAVEIRNQARVHLWYPDKFGQVIEPFKSTEEAISVWPIPASSVGVTTEGGFRVFAPHGLHDLFAMIARPNKVLVSRSAYEAKVARWSRDWPSIRVLAW